MRKRLLIFAVAASAQLVASAMQFESSSNAFNPPSFEQLQLNAPEMEPKLVYNQESDYRNEMMARTLPIAAPVAATQ